MLKHKAVIGQYIRSMGRTWELLSEAVPVRHAMSQALVTRWGWHGLCSPLQGAAPLCCSVLVFQLHGFFSEELDVFSSCFFFSSWPLGCWMSPSPQTYLFLQLHPFFTMRVPVLWSFSQLSSSPLRSCLTCCSSRCAEDEVYGQKERAVQSSCVAASKLLETSIC